MTGEPMQKPLFVVMIVLMTFSSKSTAAEPAASPETGIAKSVGQFGMDLYRRLPADENLFFSPASISTAFAMAYAGARGQTAEQIGKVMHFESPADKLGAETASLIQLLNGNGDDRGYELAMANA